MPEVLKISEGFKMGLHKGARAPKNALTLETYRGMKPMPYAGIPYADIDDPFGGGDISVSWPWPQMFVGKSVNLLAYEAAIHTITKGSPWTHSNITPLRVSPHEATECLTNGHFDSVPSASDWVLSGTTTYSSVYEKIIFTPGAGVTVQPAANLAVALVVGKTYRISMKIVITTSDGGLRIRIGDSGNYDDTSQYNTSGVWEEDVTITSGAGALDVTINPGGGLAGEVEWISIREVTTDTLSGDGFWHFSDFYDMWFLFNGTETVVKLAHDANTYVIDNITIKTGCNHRGRAVFAGFDPSDYWTSDWADFWKAQSGRADITMTMDTNYVWWSTIGGGDVLLTFFQELGERGTDRFGDLGHGSTWPLIYDYLRLNQCGFMPMPWQGTVKVTKPIGKNFIVYGDGGVTALVSQPEPVPTYGLHHLLDVGIQGRGAVAGDDYGHVFLDDTGVLWEIGPDLVPKQLDHRYFLSGLSGTVVMTMNPQDREVFIGDGSGDAYLLTKSGLAHATQHATSVYFEGGTSNPLKGIIVAASDTGFEVATGEIDFGTRDLKTIRSIRISASSPENYTVYIEYRLEGTSNFSRSINYTPDENGFVQVMIPGVDFKLHVTASSYSGADLDYIDVEWDLLGKKTIRLTLET